MKKSNLLEFRLGGGENLSDHCFASLVTRDISLKSDSFPDGRYQGIRVFYERWEIFRA